MRRMRVFALLLASILVLGGVFACAKPWSEEYYRASDVTGELSDAQQKDLDEECLDFVKTYHLDLALLAVTPDYYEGETLEEHAEEYYESCGFGYGEDKDGFAAIYDVSAEKLAIVPIGAARDAVTEDYLRFVEGAAPELRANHGIWGVMYAVYKHLNNYMEDPSQFGGGRAETGEAILPDSPALPEWYPADPANFKFFHDEDAPRVVDNADIFTDEEERRMEARITELRRELSRDIVVYTDLSAYGFGHDVWAADFYDFNGYGEGPDYEGFCLFVCMDPNDRGFWTAGTGPDSMALQTERVANALDDVLYEYMAAGKYGEGAADWIENIAGLYRKGIPFAPSWYPDRGASAERARDGAAPRVVDDKGALDEAERGMLTVRAAEIATRYGVDVVLHIMDEPTVIPEREYMETFFKSGGYGFGSDGDAIVVTASRRSSGYWICHVDGYGSCAARLTDTAQSRLEDHTASRLSDGVYRALDRCLDETEHFLRTGRAPRTVAAWAWTGVLAAFLGSIFGGVRLAAAKRKMKTVAAETDANRYLVRGSLRVAALRDDYVGTTTSKTYSPVERSSSSGGSSHSSSSGRSTYHSSYHGSSGRSHSGSGRRF